MGRICEQAIFLIFDLSCHKVTQPFILHNSFLESVYISYVSIHTERTKLHRQQTSTGQLMLVSQTQIKKQENSEMAPQETYKAALSVVRKHLSPLPEQCHSLQTCENCAYGVAAGATFGVWCLLQAQGTWTSAGTVRAARNEEWWNFPHSSVFVFSTTWVGEASSAVTMAVPKQRAFL